MELRTYLRQRERPQDTAASHAEQQDIGRQDFIIPDKALRKPRRLPVTAVAVGRAETALGSFYRRVSTRVGKAKAITATARKLPSCFTTPCDTGWEYTDPGASYDETRYRERVIKNLQRRAKTFGFILQAAAPPATPTAIS